MRANLPFLIVSVASTPYNPRTTRYQMKARSLILAICLVCVTSLHSEPSAPIPPEMKALNPFLGTWTQAEFVSKVAEWTPQEIRTRGATATTQPIMGGRCLVDDRTFPEDGAQHHGVWSW